MNNYVSPVIFDNDELAEGVYATGSGGSECYIVTGDIHQKPETGRGDYRIKINALHEANHDATHQVMTIHFNQAVVFSSCAEGTLSSGNGTDTLVINYAYHANHGPENHELGDLVVTSEPGLAITGISMDCDKTCEHNSLPQNQ